MDGPAVGEKRKMKAHMDCRSFRRRVLVPPSQIHLVAELTYHVDAVIGRGIVEHKDAS